MSFVIHRHASKNIPLTLLLDIPTIEINLLLGALFVRFFILAYEFFHFFEKTGLRLLFVTEVANNSEKGAGSDSEGFFS